MLVIVSDFDFLDLAPKAFAVAVFTDLFDITYHFNHSLSAEKDLSGVIIVPNPRDKQKLVRTNLFVMHNRQTRQLGDVFKVLQLLNNLGETV